MKTITVTFTEDEALAIMQAITCLNLHDIDNAQRRGGDESASCYYERREMNSRSRARIREALDAKK